MFRLSNTEFVMSHIGPTEGTNDGDYQTKQT